MEYSPAPPAQVVAPAPAAPQPPAPPAILLPFLEQALLIAKLGAVVFLFGQNATPFRFKVLIAVAIIIFLLVVNYFPQQVTESIPAIAVSRPGMSSCIIIFEVSFLPRLLHAQLYQYRLQVLIRTQGQMTTLPSRRQKEGPRLWLWQHLRGSHCSGLYSRSPQPLSPPSSLSKLSPETADIMHFLDSMRLAVVIAASLTLTLYCASPSYIAANML